MKIEQHCPYCMADAFKNTGASSLIFRFEQRQLSDSAIHPVKCNQGHEFAIVYNGLKFEILFDIAMSAIRDGYVREAVSSFTGALERFYEFYIKYYTHSTNVEESSFLKTWKSISNQSERQLGAYIFLYLLKNKKEPELLSSTKAKFRNSVIHKGYIPTIEEALNFGETIYKLIMSVVTELENSDGQLFKKYYQSQLPQATNHNWVVNESPKGISLARTQNGTSNLGFEHVKSIFRIV